MLLPHKDDAIHKAWLYRLLAGIYDNQILANSLYFKGGTCAAMLNWLDRFSVDLDFDYCATEDEMKNIRFNLENVFKKLGLEIKYKSARVPQYFLKYSSPGELRNTIKIDVTYPAPQANTYRIFKLTDVDRLVNCQTVETMFANKLVALIERYEQHESIAGRDLYDIHHFFMQGFDYNQAVIIERRKNNLPNFFEALIDFIQKNITEKIISQDLNFLLPPQKFQQIRKLLKPETVMFLKEELKRLNNA